tara:strand:- start:557 stop:733 length:177 start_codon:yes stop_codon:yes gene_type:complete
MNEIIDLEELETELTKVINMEYIIELGERGIVRAFEWNEKDGLTLEMKPNWRRSIACL